jgi:arylsulfatase A-like enzyme
MVSLLDVVPTLLDWAGAPPPGGLEGGSLASLLVGRAAPGPRKSALALHTASHDGSLALRGVRDEQHKLIHDDHAGTDLLFDLVKDPAERQSLAPAERDEKLAQALARLRVPEAVDAPQPDPETVKSLKALGYL